MKGGIPASIKSSLGFTIVETMIFVAISGVIFAGAVRLMGGKQGATEFSTGLSTFKSQLQRVINNVGSGYYNLPEDTSCHVNGTNITLSPVSSQIGQNIGCTFIGDVLAFGNSSNGNQDYQVFPVIGLQFANNQAPTDTTSLATAHPVSASSLSTIVSMPYGLSVYSIKYATASITKSIGSFGFFTTFNSYSNTGLLNSGSQNVVIDPMPNTTAVTTYTPSSFVTNDIDDLTDTPCTTVGLICDKNNTNISAPENPSGGILVCLNSGTTSNSALLTIGGTDSSSILNTQLYNNQDCI